MNTRVWGPVLQATWLGRIEYPEAWAHQRRLWMGRLDGDCGDTIMLLEHPPTYTLGRRAIEQDLLFDDVQRAIKGIALYNVDRGGRATYHGPGQLVGYPIVSLGERYDVLTYLRKLEEVLIRTAADLGVEAARDDDHTGVWVGDNKIGAIGVKITRGITMHGFAFNVTTDLDDFAGIVPCGIRGAGVCSLASLGVSATVEEVAYRLAPALAGALSRPLRWADPGEAGSVPAGVAAEGDRS
jgi:lipoyl(octanoyl) transferase